MDIYDYEFFNDDHMFYLNPIDKVLDIPTRHKSSSKTEGKKGCDDYQLDFSSIKNRSSLNFSNNRESSNKSQQHLIVAQKGRCNSLNRQYTDDCDYSEFIKYKIDLEEAPELQLETTKDFNTPNQKPNDFKKKDVDEMSKIKKKDDKSKSFLKGGASTVSGASS